jgi:HK97 family phage prohead protease
MDLKYIERPFEVKAVQEDGTFDGYGSIFGNVDSYKEIVAPGAFAESLVQWKESGRLPPVLWQHRSGEPIGPFVEMAEDGVGLRVKGRLLVDDVQRAKEARALMKAKAVNGLSIGFVTREDAYDRVTGISSVKSAIDGIQNLSDAEAFLRDVGRLSKSQATAFISRFKSLSGRSDSDVELGELCEALKRNASVLSKSH